MSKHYFGREDVQKPDHLRHVFADLEMVTMRKGRETQLLAIEREVYALRSALGVATEPPINDLKHVMISGEVLKSLFDLL